MEGMWNSRGIPGVGHFLLGWGKVFPSNPEGLGEAPGCAHPAERGLSADLHPALTDVKISRNLGKALMLGVHSMELIEPGARPFPGTPWQPVYCGILGGYPHSRALSCAQELQQQQETQERTPEEAPP